MKAGITIKVIKCIPNVNIPLSNSKIFVRKVDRKGSLGGVCKKNDMILSINGVDVSGMIQTDAEKLFTPDNVRKIEYMTWEKFNGI